MIPPTIIAGPGRSGTSMVARMLNLCGLDLGPEDTMIRPKADNPAGFWEQRQIVAINNAILGASGGTWDKPPESIARCEHLKAAARALEGWGKINLPWGFKDPRCCLTLPFWRAVYPGAKVVLVWRSGHEVAESLLARDRTPREDGHKLWGLYLSALFKALDGPPDAFVFYDTEMPRERLAETCDAIGLYPTERQLDAALSSIRPELRHHH